MVQTKGTTSRAWESGFSLYLNGSLCDDTACCQQCVLHRLHLYFIKIDFLLMAVLINNLM